MTEPVDTITIDIIGFEELKIKNPTKYQEFLTDYKTKFTTYHILLKNYENLMQSLDQNLTLINKKDFNHDNTIIEQSQKFLDKAEQLLFQAEQAKKELDAYCQEIKFFILYSHLPNYELKKSDIVNLDKIANNTIESIKNSEYLTEKQREDFIKLFVTNYIKENKTTDELIAKCKQQIIENINEKFNELNNQKLDLNQLVYQNLPAQQWVNLATNLINKLPNKDYLSDQEIQQFIKEFVNSKTKDYVINSKTIFEREEATRQLLDELQNNCIKLINNKFNNKHDAELTLLIKIALDSTKDKIKPLELKQIEFIETAIGKQLFEELMQKYQLTTKNFTINDLRALIIGMLLSTDQEFENNHFIKNLRNLYQAATPQILREKIINFSGKDLIKAFEVMTNASKAHSLFLSGFKELFIPYAKKLSKLFLPQADFLLNHSLLFFSCITQANRALQRDVDTVFALANVNNWNKKDQAELQVTASNEYIFNKLSLATSLKEDATIPIVETNGEINFYTVKKVIERLGVNCIALVPKDSEKSLEIKVVFQSTSNLMQEMFDLENYTTMKAFNEHKLEILNNLNKIIDDFKQNCSPEQLENLSLNVGGHGRGGALAQQLINELMMSKLAKNCDKQFDQEFDENLNAIINNKCAYELERYEQFPESVSQQNILHRYLYSRNDWYTTLKDIKDNPLKFEEHKAKIKKDFVDYLQSAIPETSAIHNFSLTTVNSGGVTMEIRNNFIIALTMLKELFQSSDKVNINCNKIMVDGNLMQLTGDTDLAVSVNPEIMPTSLIKITPKIDPKVSGSIKIFEGLLKITLYNWVLEFGETLFDIHSMLKTYNKIDPDNNLGKKAKELVDLKAKELPEEQKKLLLQLLNIATEAHMTTFFDKKDLSSFEWEILDNLKDLDLELSTKLPVPLKEYYHKVQDLFTTGKGRHLQYLQHLTSYLINTLITSPDAVFSKEMQDKITKIQSFYKISNKVNVHTIIEIFYLNGYKKYFTDSKQKQDPYIFREIDQKNDKLISKVPRKKT